VLSTPREPQGIFGMQTASQFILDFPLGTFSVATRKKAFHVVHGPGWRNERGQVID
jgi:hypothetical protein